MSVNYATFDLLDLTYLQSSCIGCQSKAKSEIELSVEAKMSDIPRPPRISAPRKADQAHWSNIIDKLSPQTRAIGLICLLIDAFFGLAIFALPSNDRFIAIIIFALLIIITIVACVWLESQNSPLILAAAQKLNLPSALKGHAVYLTVNVDNNKTDEDKKYLIASNLKFSGEFERAATIYASIISQNPSNFKARYNLGSCYIYLDKLEEAKLYFESLIKDLSSVLDSLDETEKEILHGCYIQLNFIFEKLGNTLLGINYLMKSLDIKPNDALTCLNLAIAHIKLGNESDAKRWYSILLQNPDQISILTYMSPADRDLISRMQGGGRGNT